MPMIETTMALRSNVTVRITKCDSVSKTITQTHSLRAVLQSPIHKFYVCHSKHAPAGRRIRSQPIGDRYSRDAIIMCGKFRWRYAVRYNECYKMA